MFPELAVEFKNDVDPVADMSVYNPFDFFVKKAATKFPLAYGEEIAPDISIYMQPELAGPLLSKIIKTVSRDPMIGVNFLAMLSARLVSEINNEIRLEPGVQTAELTLGRASESCRDSSWLLVQILRNLDLAARFVPGFLI